MNQQRIRIGTSGWHYDHWRGPFYPADLGKEAFLGHYVQHFDAVEINNTFYRLPETAVLEKWRSAVGPDFVFSAKASRYITHMKKLKDPEASVAAFFERIRALSHSLGPVLFQLPPRWRADPGRLEAFLSALPSDCRYAFEFRDPSWFSDDCLQVLSRWEAAFCIYDLAGQTSPRETTTDFVYVRLHGPGKAYHGSYDPSELAGWAGAFSTWARQGKEVFCFFDNDQGGHAALNALKLREMLI